MTGEAITVLEAFVEKNKTPGSPLNLNLSEKKDLVSKIVSVLSESNGKPENQLTALTATKVLSREKSHLDDILEEPLINQLLRHAGISPQDLRESSVRKDQNIYEAQRCFNNLLLQSPVARAFASKDQTLPGISELLVKWKDLQIPPEMLTFDIKILFLVTALCTETRKKLLLDHRGVQRLQSLIEDLISTAKCRAEIANKESQSPTSPVLEDEEVDLLGEVLKLLFNVTLNLEENQLLDEGLELQLGLICDHVQTLYAIETKSQEKTISLHTNCTNLLSNVPMSVTRPLLSAPKKDIVKADYREYEYDGDYMNVPKAMLDLLIYRIDKQSTNGSGGSLKETATPILSVLCQISRYHRKVRKFLKATILPPLREVKIRPEVGESSRNKLCKLLTSPVDAVSVMTAEFLFILCKESVQRLVKYTGYGNAAGLLARRGLMMGGRSENAACYSEDSDSDTEEYLENVHKINPISGFVEPKRPSPFEGMTEEQKEFEAMKLVNLINDMQNMGVVMPAVPGPDGRPMASEHVLQFRENVERMSGNPVQQEGENSDSD